MDGWSQKERPADYPAWFLDVLANRGVSTSSRIAEFLDPKYEALSSPNEFNGIKGAVERITLAKEKNEHVVVYGDYDVDGICATAIMIESLGKIGIQAEGYIPHREEEGYGLNEGAVQEIQKKGCTLIITVDCGITSKGIIDDSSIDFIVCDHHEMAKETMPKKAICLHPELVKKGEPRHFSAAGMAFYLARGLQAKYPDEFLPGQEKWLLDLVALSTICDVVPLNDENRILAKWGLLVLSKTKRTGLIELIKMAGIEKDKIGAYEAGFIIGPRLNAAGRLAHAKKALNLLLTKEHIKAREIAGELTTLNTERQAMCARILEEATAEIEQKKKTNKILVLSGTGWPRGVVGIIASKISDQYARPAIVFEDDGKVHHGSARSVEGFDITEALAACSEHLERYGGHAKAAGLAVQKEKLALFETAIEKIGNKLLKKELTGLPLAIDARIKSEEINEETIGWLEKLDPHGYGNPVPVLGTRAKIRNIKKVGQSGNHLKFLVVTPAGNISAIFFSANMELSENREYDLAFNLRFNWWNNRRTVEMRIIDVKEVRANEQS